jgi:hypothetical protein
MRKHVRLPLGPTAPEQKVTQRRVALTIAGKEIAVQTVAADAAEIDFGVLEFQQGDEFVFTGSDGDAANNWSEPPTERRLTPFRDTEAPSPPVLGDPVFDPADDEAPEPAAT